MAAAECRQVLVIDCDREFAEDVAVLLESEARVAVMEDLGRDRGGQPCPFDLVIAAEEALIERPALKAWLERWTEVESRERSASGVRVPIVLLLRHSETGGERSLPSGWIPTARHPRPLDLLGQVKKLLERSEREVSGGNQTPMRPGRSPNP